MEQETEKCLVREAESGDCVQLQKLYTELVSDSDIGVNGAQIDRIRKSDRSFLFLADFDGSIRGTVLVSICADAMYLNQPFAVVENLVVGEESRGIGIGLKLMRKAETLCKDLDCSKMMLLSSVTRPDAHSFFQRIGFEGGAKRGFVKYRRHFD